MAKFNLTLNIFHLSLISTSLFASRVFEHFFFNSFSFLSLVMEDALLQTLSHSFVDCVFWRLLGVLCSILFHLLAPSSPVVPLQTPEGAECLVYPSEHRPAHAPCQRRCLDRRLSDTKHDINILAHVFCASFVSEGFFLYLFFFFIILLSLPQFLRRKRQNTLAVKTKLRRELKNKDTKGLNPQH